MAIGKVIKSEPGESSLVGGGDRPGAARRPVMNAEVYDAKQQANQIIAQAQAQAQEILAKAQEERQQMMNQGREEGRQEGLKSLSELLVRAKMAANEMVRQSQPQALELALKIAEKILGRDLERDPQLLVDICANAMETVRSAKQVVFRVNPKAGQVLRERKAELMQAIGRSVDVAIKDDPDVEQLGCVIQTEFGTIDAQLTTQLQMLQNLLLPADGRKEGPQ
jgi:type III secretion protein L